jgi:CMP-N-acetylneuraminic acid synthetase
MAGLPLIAWTIKSAMECRLLDRLIVSTEDPEIAEIAIHYGAEVPFLRPIELADDQSTTKDVMMHALGVLPDFEFFALLQPTSPLRLPIDIEAALNLAQSGQVSSVVSICLASEHPEWQYRIGRDGVLSPFAKPGQTTRRQDLTSSYVLNGAVYVRNSKLFLRDGTFVRKGTVGFVMPRDRSIDVDDELDWFIAEALMKRREDG